MLPLLQLLFRHQAWADRALLKAVAQQPGAFEDQALSQTLLHMVVVQRAFLALFLEREFSFETERRMPASGAGFAQRFRETGAEFATFLSTLEEATLARPVSVPWFPTLAITLGEAMTQVAMHSQAHRGQSSARLRTLGGAPPATDFIVWLNGRPDPEW